MSEQQPGAAAQWAAVRFKDGCTIMDIARGMEAFAADAVRAERERILDRLYSAWEHGDFALSLESMIAIVKGGEP